ncbi:hypothetical protein AAHC03_01903 [Spirometra sp. Aus1]
MVLLLASLILQILPISAENYTILLTYGANVSSSAAQTRFDAWANACGGLRGNSFTLQNFPAISDGISLEEFRSMSASLKDLNVVGVLGGKNYFLNLLNQTPDSTCGAGVQLATSTLDISMTGMLEVGVAYINFLRRLQNTGDYASITQSEKTIIALPKYFTTVANPFEVEQILDGAANLETSMNVFWYTKSTDSAVLGGIIGGQQPTNVIALLNTDDINALLEYAYKYDLFDWSMRWVLMSPYGPLPNLPTNITVINANVTVIGLGYGNLGGEINSLSAADKLAVDAADIAFAYFSGKCYACPAQVQPPANITGSFNLSDPQTPRMSTAYSVYLNLGAAQSYNGSIVAKTGQTPIINASPVYAYNGTKEEVLAMLRTRPLRIVAALATPFVMINDDKIQLNNLPANVDLSSLTGLSVDIMKKIVVEAKLSYKLTLYAGAATDLLNLLKSGEADVAIGNYAVLPELTASFDFLSNYLYFTYSVLEAPSKALPVGATLFDFFGPLTSGFWVLILFSAIITALALATLNYFSPNWVDYGFNESIFATFGCLFQGLSVSPPNQWSSRILISVWWMFVLFFVIIYAANYGALKARNGMSGEVSGFDKLLVDPSIPFGPIANSTASLQLQSSSDLKIQQLTYLSARLYGNVAPSKLEDAVSLVANGYYRLIGDRFTLQYFAMLKCLSVSGEYGTEQYAIVLQKNAYFQGYFQSIIEDLINAGEMKALTDSYTLGNTGTCPSSTRQGTTIRFVNNLDTIGGIFILVAIGIVVAIILAIIECVFWRKIAPFAERAARTPIGFRLRNFC